uniref:replication protein A 70 kDa DNA-binding subunit-like n=1 Tax=Erigeron canadensis TaxID=72917 RepID=UPI001CB96A83|nr:replication protein A 70 kDa DNA-binding subunit-like [Erigeron canadensis]
MERGYSLLSEISDVKDTWRIKVHVGRMWTQPGWKKDIKEGSLEMILIDKRGTKMHATIKKNLPKLKHMLQESRYYLITNFNVGDSTSKFMMVNNEACINFYRNTSVRPCISDVDYGNGLVFTSFEDIAAFRVVTKYPIDIIVEIVGRGKITKYTKDNKQSMRLHLQLMDLSGILMNCALWGDYAHQVDNFFKDPKNDGRVVIVIQLAKLRIWDGEPQLDNCMFGTRI